MTDIVNVERLKTQITTNYSAKAVSYTEKSKDKRYHWDLGDNNLTVEMFLEEREPEPHDEVDSKYIQQDLLRLLGTYIDSKNVFISFNFNYKHNVQSHVVVVVIVLS